MKPVVSVVTISYNQKKYLGACIDSVISQVGYFDLEYIIVDPGSTDGSRELIKSYECKIISIFREDAGPADGLNNGFKVARGDYLMYLNSDDVLLPGAIQKILNKFNENKLADVVHGHCWIIDGNGERRRKCYSDKFDLKKSAYGASIIIQPSSAFKMRVFKKVGGFNIENKSNWDGELFVDMGISGAKFVLLNEIISEYRVHGEGITGTGRLALAHHQHARKMFLKIKGRAWSRIDEFYFYMYKIIKHVRNPMATIERIKNGSIYGSAK